MKKVDRIPENCFLHDIYLSSVKMECKTEVADSAFADCRRLSDIEYGQWDFSDTEDIYISDAPMRKMRRPFFRIKVILKNEPRLESGKSIFSIFGKSTIAYIRFRCRQSHHMCVAIHFVLIWLSRE